MLPTPELERSVSYRFGTAEGGQSKKTARRASMLNFLTTAGSQAHG